MFQTLFFLSSGNHTEISKLEVIKEADRISIYKEFFAGLTGSDTNRVLDYAFNDDISPDISNVQDIEI